MIYCTYNVFPYTGGINGCDGTTCTLGRTDDKHYFCCCYGDICNLESRIVFPSIPSVIPNVSSTNVKLMSTRTFYSSVMESVSPTAAVISSSGE